MKISVGLLSVSLFVSALLSGCSSGTANTSTSTTTTPLVAAPTVASVSPVKLAAGVAATTLTVTGTGFLSSTTIQVAGILENTTYISATQVSAVVPASQLASGGMLNVIASNGSASSATGTVVNLEVDNPAPTITQFVPATFTTNVSGASLAVAGTGFVPATILQINGVAHSVTFVSSTQVNVLLTAADLATPGSLNLIAVNAAPGGGSSAAASVPVNNPSPGLIALNPATVITGATTPTTVTVTGANFLPTSVVQVGIIAASTVVTPTLFAVRATSYVSPTQLTFQLTVADQALASRLGVIVVNPAPVGGTSATALLTVSAPTATPVITQVLPMQFVTGSASANLTVYGTGLTSSSTLQWNGTALTGSYIYGTSTLGINTSTYLSVTVPGTLLATSGTATVTASTPSAPVPLSNAVTVTIANPPAPVVTSFSPNAGPINTAATLAINGTGFTSGSTVTFDGVALATVYNSSTSLSAALPASSVGLPGNLNLVVTTPAPGGGTSTPSFFTAYVPIVNNSMIFNPVNGLFYASIPGSVGAPMGNSVVSIDPATGQIGTPIYVGSEPNKLALTSDGLFLWVGLDGAAAVRKVDLTTGKAGLQFELGPAGTGYYQTPPTAIALAALPGATDSVIVSAPSSATPSGTLIYDAGVLRAGSSAGNVYAYALQVDGTRKEIYAGGSGLFNLNYSASGLTLLHSNTAPNISGSTLDEFQLASGTVYTDNGIAYNAESGAPLGTFYVTGTTVAAGASFADLTLGKYFVVDNPSSYYFDTTSVQVQIFNTSDYNATSAAVIPIHLGTNLYATSVTRLSRWGTNGLAFRTSIGLFSVRSNLVKDLSTVFTDLGVAVAATGTSLTGSTTIYTATVSNSGPAAATGVSLTASVPATGVVASVTPSVGSCYGASTIVCNLAGLASGANATVAIAVTQLTAGTATLTAHVSGSETDPVATNNIATSTSTITGSAASTTPGLLSLSPSTIQSGAADTVLTATGTNFDASSSIYVGGTKLTSTLANSTTLSATVPTASLASLGWLPVVVTNSNPGGGTSNALPLTIYSVVNLTANHILYDPFTRKLMGSVASTSTTVTGNSIVAITPETATIGTPVPIGSQPTLLALTSDGQILYTLLAGNTSIARFNMLTQQADFTVSVGTSNYSSYGPALATQPGTENTVAVQFGIDNGLVDFNPTAKTAALRASGSSTLNGSCFQFLDATNLLSVDTYSSGAQLYHYVIPAVGGVYTPTTSNINRLGCIQTSGGLIYGNSGAVADPSTAPATPLGLYPVTQNSTFSNFSGFVPDNSLKRTFYLGNITSLVNYSGVVNGISVFDQPTYLGSTPIPLTIASTENNLSVSAIDLIRWGQDGIAALTSAGHIYLVRGPAVVPQEMNVNSAATLASGSSSTIAHGSGNTLLTLTGSNFIPGVGVTWNGSYRTTTIVDATHVTVAIPASDLVTAGSAALIATNPGAPASATVTVTIN